MDRRYVGIKDLSEYLGLTEGTLYVWVHYGKIPYIKFGKAVRFDLRDIDRWAAKRKVKPFFNSA